MRITGFDVEDFGVLHDTRVEDLPPGLTIVTGPNGAGKSSLHALLVRVLYGFPRSNAVGVTRHFPPLHGRRRRGSVSLRDDAGQPWRVTRQDEGSPRLLVELPDGSTATTVDVLRDVLGGLDQEGFEQVFAIDLARLSGMADLPGEELQSLLFEAATLGTAGSLRGARAAAEQRASELYRPAGRQQPVAVLRRERDELRRALRDAQAAAGGIAARNDEIAHRRAERERLRADRAALAGRLAVIELATRAWPLASRLRTTQEQLSGVSGPQVDDATRAAMRDARDAAADAAAELARLDEQRDEAERELAAAVPDDRLAAVRDDVTRLTGQLEVHRDRVRRQGSADERLAAARRAAAEAVAHVGHGLDAAAVSCVRVDGGAVDALEDGRDRVERLVAAHEAAVAEAARSARRAADEGAAIDDRARTLAATRPDADAVVDGEGALAVLDRGLPLLLEHEVARADRERLVRAAPAAPAAGGPPPVVGRVLVALGLVSVAAGLLLPSAGVTALGALVLFGGALLVGRTLAGGAHGADAHAVPADARGPMPSDRIDRLAEDVAAAATTLGLAPRPGFEELARARQQVEAERRAVTAHEVAQGALAEDRRRLGSHEKAARAAARNADDAAAAFAAAHDRWRSTLADVGLDGLPDDLRPTQAVAVHGRVRDAAGALAAVEEAAAATEEIAGLVDGFATEAVAVVRTAGGAPTGPADAVDALPGLAEAFAQDAAARSARARLAEHTSALAARRAEAEARATAVEQEQAALLASLGLPDVAAYDAAVVAEERRRELAADVAAGERELGVLLGDGETARAVRELLDAPDPGAWQAEADALASERARLDDAADLALAEIVRLERDVADLGGSDAVADLALRLAMVEGELADVATRWATLEVARGILEAAVEHFEQQQQPVVLREASRSLAAFTLGRWGEVRQVDRELYVVAPDSDEHVPADQLSTGEQSQLYLALRVALAAQRGPTLPLLLDDLLVSADDDRADAIVTALGAMTDRRQVLLFTASGRTVEAARTRVPGAAVIRLDAGRATRVV